MGRSPSLKLKEYLWGASSLPKGVNITQSKEEYVEEPNCMKVDWPFTL